MTKHSLIYTPTNKKQVWGQLYGSSLPLAVAEYCLNTPGIKLLVAPDNLSVNQLQAELTFFLGNASSAQELLVFPDWETLPYDQFSPHQDLISERLYTLSRMQQLSEAIVITSTSTLMHYLCPPSFLHQYALMLKEGQTLVLEVFRNQLQQAGYRCVSKVFEHGEYAVRGSIIDLYPMGSSNPFRIELFDDNIDSLRMFDTETQRTIEKIKQINILPARELPLNETTKTLFRRNFRDMFPGNPSHCPVYESISENQFPSGIEYYLPLFFEEAVTLFDYLPDSAHICLIENIQAQAEQFWQEINES